MPVPYKNIGPVDTTVEPDLTKLKDKNVIVTGGSSGLGAAYVEGFLKAGAYVTNADIQPAIGYTPPTDGKYQFVKCDVTKFAEQVNVFKAALKLAPSGLIDIVIANAGITAPDPVFRLTDTPDPEEPNLKILDVNLNGVLYTAKCAMHYWQFDSRPGEQKCFIIKSSLAGYITVPSASLYTVSKYGVRGLMAQMRLSDRCRVNVIAPWFVKTPILKEEGRKSIGAILQAQGSDWAEAEDALKAVLRVSTDESINGRALGIVYKQAAKEGYIDCEADEFPEGTLLNQWSSWSGMMLHRTTPTEKK